MCNFNSFNGGVPIPDPIHFQYSPKVQEAWRVFDDWWKQQSFPVRSSDMPEEVLTAFNLILDTPIPTYEKEGYTGKDSCYMRGVLFLMEE